MTGMCDEDYRGRLLPAEARPARLVVCEASGRWAVGLRRELKETPLRMRQTRTLEDCWGELAQAPASFLVVELREMLAVELLQGMVRLARHFPLARVAVVAHRRLADYEWLMREAGAVHFTTSLRRLGPVAQVAGRHLRDAPVPAQSPTQRIWACLPWKSASQSAGTDP